MGQAEYFQKGQMLILAVVIAGLILVNTLVIISGSLLYFKNSDYTLKSAQALHLAEAGIDKALTSLNSGSGSYSGEETNFGAGSYEVRIISSGDNAKTIESTGYIPSKADAKVKKRVQITASKGTGAAFNYGIQVGEGGIQMGGNNKIRGSIFSNGDVNGKSNDIVTGDVWVAGGTMEAASVESMCQVPGCSDLIFAKNISGEQRIDVAQSFKPKSAGVLNKISLNLKKNGAPGDIKVHILKDNEGSPDKSNVVATATLSSYLVTSSYGWIDITFDTTVTLTVDTTYWIVLDASSNSGNYWISQSDITQGYVNGLSKWSSDWRDNTLWNTTGKDMDFRLFMGGLSTVIDGKNGLTVEGNAYANIIRDLTVKKDAYYQTISGSTVLGSSHPGSQDPSPRVLPISDANISAFKSEAQEEGSVAGDISLCPATLGPGKISGKVTLDGCNVKVKSPVWITGNLTLKNGNTLKLDDQIIGISGVILADGVINIENNNNIQGSGSSGSVLLLVSVLDSRKSGDSAIDVKGSGNTGAFFAGNGIINVTTSNTFKELSAWKIILSEDVVVDYQTGLASIFFSSGPTGSYSLVKGTYRLN